MALASGASVDAPELAHPGPFAVGVRTVTLTDRDRPDVLAPGRPRRDRVLTVDLWYPAVAGPGRRAVYAATLPTAAGGQARFTVAGVAVRGAPAVPGAHSLVIVSHGYSNVTATMVWLTENLASKGYVVAAIRHDDPPITDAGKFAGPLFDRPLDIGFVARGLGRQLAAEGLTDGGAPALIGYSMGGYGVLTTAGARLDPAGIAGQLVGHVTPLGVSAVVAIAPAGGGPLAAWGQGGLAGVTAPLLLVAGDADRVVDYASGARAMFDAATAAPRYLLTFADAGHALGLGPAPAAMRGTLWNQDWFEDPVWRKDRLNGITLHMITAFLDRHVRRDAGRAAYLDVAVARSDAGVWPAGVAPGYDAYSPGSGGVTVWKGFRRNQARGLELLRAAPR